MKLVAVAVVMILATVEAGVTSFTQCGDVPQDACKVTEVRIRDCNSYPCRLKTNTIAYTEVVGTPYFTGDNLKMAIYWVGNPFGDFPVNEGGELDACQFTACPLQSGQQATLSYPLKVPNVLISGTYTFKCKLWNADDETQVCCFETKAHLVQ